MSSVTGKMIFHTSTTSKIPLKAMLNKALSDSIEKNKKLIPVHLQLSITNKCNKNCSFCSFKQRNKSLELDYVELKKIINTFLRLGTQAVTITGGGEPLCHPDINKLLLYCQHKKLKVGLVTNGTMLNNLEYEAAKAITWCRISLGDDQDNTQIENIETVLSSVIPKLPFIVWSYSYVVLENQNPLLQVRAAKFAKSLGLINVRFLPDQSNIFNIDMVAVKENMEKNNLADFCVFDEKTSTEFPDKCWLYLLRPFVVADGSVYSCCCIQYCSSEEKSGAQPVVCHYSKYKQKLNNTEMYKPKCNICFFEHYNHYINAALNGAVREYIEALNAEDYTEYMNAVLNGMMQAEWV